MSADIAWAISDDLVDYPVALKAMEEPGSRILLLFADLSYVTLP